MMIDIVYGLGGRDCAVTDIEKVYDRLFNMIETGQTGPVYNHMGQRD
jgi:pyruvate ferredoxin oxidoreductase alpha subunit